jgi:hypothetical protein
MWRLVSSERLWSWGTKRGGLCEGRISMRYPTCSCSKRGTSKEGAEEFGIRFGERTESPLLGCIRSLLSWLKVGPSHENGGRRKLVNRFRVGSIAIFRLADVPVVNIRAGSVLFHTRL